MSKEIDRHKESGLHQEDVDLLRAIAGYPVRGLSSGRTVVNSRVIHIYRDANGNVINSVERIEQSDINNIDGNWAL